MATITASDVKKLRDQTGAGMMDCKAALEEAGGNFEEATTVLRKRGLASAAKKAGRATSEGVIGQLVSADRSKGILVEVNCESDFVARTDDFQALVRDVLAAIDRAGDTATESWLKDPKGPVHLRVAEGIGVQVEFGGVPPALTSREEFTTLVKEIAMQIAAANPAYVSRSAVPVEILEKERAIYRAQMESSGKPAAVIDKIIEGKLGSYYQQVVLPDQASIRDPKMTVADVLASAGKALGAPVTVNRFARLKVGEAAL
jgi:elongation factor Ts